MSRIFSYEEISTGQVPDARNFTAAKEAFQAEAQTAINVGAVDGSFIFGSVAWGVANQRSDFDTFVALSDGKERNYTLARHIFAVVAEEAEHKLPITPIVQTKQSLLEGHHEMDRYFGMHLSNKLRIVQGNDPANLPIKYREQSAYGILAGYLAQKKRHLTDAYTSLEPLDSREGCGIQRMLELPTAIGRKVLQALTEIGYIHDGLSISVDKGTVIQQNWKLLVQEGAVEIFDELIKANGDYDKLLDETMAGRVDQAEYEGEVLGLHHQLPRAIIWINQLERILLPKLTKNQNI